MVVSGGGGGDGGVFCSLSLLLTGQVVAAVEVVTGVLCHFC